MEKVDNLISLREASNLTGYNPDYLSQLVRSGKLKGIRVGRNWFTTQKDVLVYHSRKKHVDSAVAVPLKTRLALIGAAFLTIAAGGWAFFFMQPVSSAAPKADSSVLDQPAEASVSIPLNQKGQ